MSGRLQARLRQALRAAPDGLTASELMVELGLSTRTVQIYSSLKGMPDVYIDRWATPYNAAVYVAVEVPANCPRPEVRNA